MNSITCSLNNEIKQHLDESIGSDIKNLKNVEEMYRESLAKKLKLEKQLSAITTEVPKKIKAALTSAEETLEKVEEFELAKDCINAEVSQCLDKCALGVDKFQQSVNKVNEIGKYMSYMKWLAKIDETSGEVQQYILSDSMKDACLTFKQLVEYYTSMGKNSSKCFNLIAFIKKTIFFWYNILKNKLTKELDGVMKQINWPFISAAGPNTFPLSATTEKVAPSPYTAPNPALQLESVIGSLLLIQLPDQLCDEPTNSNEAEKSDLTHQETADTVLLPFQILLRPLKKRFRFHFTGNKPTNALHKPEWYLTQILNWVSYHAGFLENTVQTILDNHDHGHVDALMMFTQGLLQLATGKLSVDIEEILFDDDLFSHTVDEVLLFDRELRVTYDITDSLLKTHGPLKVLAQPECIKKWLYIERICNNTSTTSGTFTLSISVTLSVSVVQSLHKYAQLPGLGSTRDLAQSEDKDSNQSNYRRVFLGAGERLDALLVADRAWQSKFSNNDDNESDEMKTPECAESFITMLQTITDRYKNLPLLKQQLQFLDLQLLLLDDFRIRLTQVIRSVASSEFDDISVGILNASFYITTVLKDWADNVFFLQLKYHKDNEAGNTSANQVVPRALLSLGEDNSNATPNTGRSTDETVFESTIALYHRIHEEGVESIVQTIMAEFKAKSQQYANDQWLALPPAEEQVTLVVSRSACPMLEVLQERLYAFEQKLCRELFTKLWRNVAENVDSYLYVEPPKLPAGMESLMGQKVVEFIHEWEGEAEHLVAVCFDTTSSNTGIHTRAITVTVTVLIWMAVRNHFNAGGAIQLQFDMTRNLFPLFGPYTNRPENYFKRMKEACLVLNLQFGSALLLKETINDSPHPKDPFDRSVPTPDPASVLADVGVYLLKPSDVSKLLKRRVDWTTT